MPSSEARQIYALSFFVYNEDDDPRRPTLTVGYNTTQQWRQSVGEASSSDEAKWNYAFWLQNELLQFGGSGSPSAVAVADWIAEQGLAYSDEQEDADFDRCLELGDEITVRFVATACELASWLHDQGIVAQSIGRPVPIVVHELEYYEQIADQTERCNPQGLAAGFVGWVRGGCH